MHSACADPCGFPPCGKLDHVICGNRRLCLCLPLNRGGREIHHYFCHHGIQEDLLNLLVFLCYIIS